jgi:meso-butanediol dehydrogenase/(S,S)-butanediol dehydrogenase/diacetyl reductase
MLSDKVIFLTGGTEGIGFECAKAYSDAGARLSILSNNVSSINAARKQFNNENIIYLEADVSSDPDIKNAINATIDKFGRIDAIHNNAGITFPSVSLDGTTEVEWDLLMNVNVKSIYLTTKYGIELLRKTKGCILNTSSLVGEIGQSLHAAYVATKGAVNAITKAMALDYAADGIRVNAVAPAAVKTAALKQWSRDQPDATAIDKYLDHLHPLGPCPEADVIADACVFLLSDKARFITGCILPVSGGAELGYRQLTY